MALPFQNRSEAGRFLAEKLARYEGGKSVVLGLPRGGVPVAREVAGMLHAPLDVFVVRKLGVPGHPELAMGAVGSGGTVIMNEDVLRFYTIEQADIDRVVEAEKKELDRRERTYREGRPPLDIKDTSAILVDDGLATGASMRVAVEAVRAHQPREVIVAVPVAPPSTCEEMRKYADDVVCAETPAMFQAVGQWYVDFAQTTDDEVRAIMAETHSA